MNAAVVALGGGHGLASSLMALRMVTDQITAIVTVADDGGSSGRLRADRGLLPPGDLRMALSALTEDPVVAELFQHRFAGTDDLAGHPVGNLILAGLFELALDPVAALARAAHLAYVPHTVLPMAVTPIEILANVAGLDQGDLDQLTVVRGQHNVATTAGTVRDVWIEPADAPACPQAVAAVGAADVIVLGPGSLYTSVLVHMLVPELRIAVERSRAARILVLNLDSDADETRGMTARSHLEAIAAHAPALRLDVVIADTSRVLDTHDLIEAARVLGAEVVFAELADTELPGRHDPKRLAAALSEALTTLARSTRA